MLKPGNKILLVGETYSDNLGDDIICEIANNVLLSENFEIENFDISGKININDHYKNRYIEVFKNTFKRTCKFFPFILNISSLFKLIKKREDNFFIPLCKIIATKRKREHYKAIVFAGGEMFIDFFAPLIYFMIKIFRNQNIVFHACGSSLNSKSLSADGAKIFKKCLNDKNVISISARDSYEKICEISNNCNIDKTYDFAFMVGNYYESAEKKYDIGINVFSLDEYYECQKQLLNELKSSNLTWKLFTNGNIADENTAKKLINELHLNEDDYIMERPCSPKELINNITQFNKIISFRMHALIVAMTYRIPAYGIVWDNKVENLMNVMNMPQNYCEPNKINFNEILAVLNKTKIDAKLIEKYGQDSKNNLLSQLHLIN